MIPPWQILFVCATLPSDSVLTNSLFALDRQPGADYRARRVALSKKLNGGVAVLFAATESEGPNAIYGFRQDNDFFYLTGWAEPGAAVVIAPAVEAKGDTPARPYTEILFLPAHNPTQEKWTGPKLGADDPNAAAITGFDRVATLEQMRDLLREIVPQPRAVIYSAMAEAPETTPSTAPLEWLKRSNAFPNYVSYAGVEDKIAELRKHKDARRDRTHSPRHPGFDCRTSGGDAGDASGTVRVPDCGADAVQVSGRRLRASGVCADCGIGILLDCAALLGKLARDPRRRRGGDGRGRRVCDVCQRHHAHPAGQWTLHAAAARDLQRGAGGATGGDEGRGGGQKHAERRRPDSLYKVAYDYINSHGKDLHGEPLGKYFIHGLGHRVGLEVHDVGTGPLDKGDVFTVEPGIYIPEEKIGVRIEDIVMLDESGKLVNLTAELPHTAEEVEAAMHR